MSKQTTSKKAMYPIWNNKLVMKHPKKLRIHKCDIGGDVLLEVNAMICVVGNQNVSNKKSTKVRASLLEQL